MKKKQYIAPYLSFESIKPVRTILFVSGSSDENDYIGGFDPTSQSGTGAPKRLGKMYI